MPDLVEIVVPSGGSDSASLPLYFGLTLELVILSESNALALTTGAY